MPICPPHPAQPIAWNASADGRFVGVGGPTTRLDVDTHEATHTPIHGRLSGDATVVVGLNDAQQVVRVDIATGRGDYLPPLPVGWTRSSLDATSADSRKVVVGATNANFADQGVFERGATTGQWREIGPDTGPTPCPGACSHGLISADGGTVVLQTSGAGQQPQVWAMVAGGRRLVSGTFGGGPANGTSVPLDVSPDGSKILFWSTATDLDGVAGGDGSGRLYLYHPHGTNGLDRPIHELPSCHRRTTRPGRSAR